MGTSTRYSSASEITANHSDDLLLALARVEQSLKLVLVHIATIQREMGINTSLVHDLPLKPDKSWIGTP